MRRVGVVALCLLIGSLVACGPAGGGRGPTDAPTAGAGALQDVRDIAQLEARFNRDAGKPRLVLLVSPT